MYQAVTHKEIADLARTILIELIRSPNLVEVLAPESEYSLDDVAESAVRAAKKILL